MSALPEEEARRQAKEREERKQRQLDEDLRAVLATRQGRAVVWNTISHVAAAFSASYAGEPLATAFNEGRRDVGLSLVQHAQRVAPRLYLLMLSEHVGPLPEKVSDAPDAVHGPRDE